MIDDVIVAGAGPHLFTVSIDAVENSAFCGRVHLIDPAARQVPGEPAFGPS
ncbi:hypothetical protein ACFT8W_00910 [Streptomyces hygroscopicus]|uniref:hypothetical protein n=1 Tax=Streptomyces hygroscopicus TaxID=1912 RepID=UPI00363BAB47